jgi:hypothetical protein
MERFFDAYLDIETTGLSWISSIITVVGIYLSRGPDGEFSQLTGIGGERCSISLVAISLWEGSECSLVTVAI